MSLVQRFFLALISGLALLSAGCLSIGGRTEIIQQNKELEERIVQLENRIQLLEHYAKRPPKATDAVIADTATPPVEKTAEKPEEKPQSLASAPEPAGWSR